MISFYTQDAKRDLPKLRGVTVSPALGVGDWVRCPDPHWQYLAKHGSTAKVVIYDRQLKRTYAWLRPNRDGLATLTPIAP